ncbi:CRISPR-associated endonuclease Cas1 [Streptomyces sp. A1-5]|uniref:CRISPR-associated endonuclease Cas1 n=1 Tax=Streptomyces sp. A1-5 TaxID=2738410 RepID=UPI001F3FD5C7|nr:CRISPR-associated endonuclease Cas1 [Streptomyces sp. A1-5]UJB45727.1 CRISPR-associated endonuclease Cas1 [Streptomyces sp. A1-5]
MTDAEIPELADIFAPRIIGPTLIVEGFGAKLTVERGQLAIHDGFGPHRRTEKLSRIERRVERIIVTAVDGYVTLDALRWCRDVGISVVMLDPAGDVLMTSEHPWRDGRLHRAQALGSPKAVRYIMDRKLTGQYEVSGHPRIKDGLIRLHDAEDLSEISAIEAKASRYYWGSMRGTKVNFRDDVPEHWKTFQRRSSSLQATGKTPRKAVTPFNAMLNLAYSIGYAESRLACHALGLDTELGLLHRPKESGRSHHSMTLDLVEVARPYVDQMILNVVSERVFTRRDFYETIEGQCTVGSPLDREIIERAREAVRQPLAEAAEDVAHILGDSCDVRVEKRTPLTRRNAKRRNQCKG